MFSVARAFLPSGLKRHQYMSSRTTALGMSCFAGGRESGPSCDFRTVSVDGLCTSNMGLYVFFGAFDIVLGAF